MSKKSFNATHSKGGPGNSVDAKHPEKHHPSERTSGGQEKTADHLGNPAHSSVSGGGGERDKHHTHHPGSRS